MLTMTGVNRLLSRQVVPISWDIEPIMIKTSGLPPALVLTRNPVTRISTLNLPARLLLPELTVDSDGAAYLIGSTRWEVRP